MFFLVMENFKMMRKNYLGYYDVNLYIFQYFGEKYIFELENVLREGYRQLYIYFFYVFWSFLCLR